MTNRDWLIKLAKIQRPAQMVKFLEYPGQKPSRLEIPQATKNKLLPLSAPGTKEKAQHLVRLFGFWKMYVSHLGKFFLLLIKLPERNIWMRTWVTGSYIRITKSDGSIKFFGPLWSILKLFWKNLQFTLMLIRAYGKNLWVLPRVITGILDQNIFTYVSMIHTIWETMSYYWALIETAHVTKS